MVGSPFWEKEEGEACILQNQMSTLLSVLWFLYLSRVCVCVYVLFGLRESVRSYTTPHSWLLRGNPANANAKTAAVCTLSHRLPFDTKKIYIYT